MASNAFSGIGTTLQMGAETIAEINSISGPNMSRDQIDVTSLDSTSGYREFIAGFRDGGELQLNMNFTRDSYDDFLAAFQDDAYKAFTIVLPDTGATTFTFNGWVTGLGMAVPLDDKVTSDVTIKISGLVTMAS